MIDFEMNDTDDGDDISLGNAKFADFEIAKEAKTENIIISNLNN